MKRIWQWTAGKINGFGVCAKTLDLVVCAKLLLDLVRSKTLYLVVCAKL